MSKKLIIALGSVAAIALPHAAMAEGNNTTPQTAPTPNMQMQTPAAQEVSDTQLQQFVEVEKQVKEISKDYEEKLADATDPAEQSELKSEANKEMAEVISDSELSVPEYNKIAMLISSNPDLQKKYQQHRSAQ